MATFNLVSTKYRFHSVLLGEALQKPHLHLHYNWGMMQKYGIAASGSCEKAAETMKSATETMVWKKYFEKAYELHMTHQHKVSGIMYLILAYIGEHTSQINAANILEEFKIFKGKSFQRFTIKHPDLSIELAYKYYKEAYKSFPDILNFKLGLNYFHGYVDEPNIDLAVLYFQGAAAKGRTNTQVAYGLFHLGNINQFGMGVDVDTKNARKMYNMSLQYDPHLNYLVKVLNVLLDFSEGKRQEILPLPNYYVATLAAIWTGLIALMILKKK